MKKFRVFSLLILSITLLSVFALNVNALTLTKGDLIYTHGGNHVYVKYIDDNEAYCLSGINVPAGDANSSCTYVGEDTGLAYIFNSYGDGNYLAKEIDAIYYYTNGSGNIGDKTANTTLINTAKTQKTTYDAIKASTFAVTLDSNSLTFTRDGDFYKSQTIHGSGLNYVDGAVTISPSGVTGATIVGNYSSFYVKVPVANLTNTATITVSISATQQSYSNAKIYYCGSSSNQRLAVLESVQPRTASKSISGTIEATKLTIIKKDENNIKLAGVKIRVTGPNNYSEEFTTTANSNIEINNLEFGTYTITEVESIAGYNKLSEPKTVIIGSNNLTATVTLINSLTETIISKKNAVDGDELPGATLEILDKDKNKMSCTIIDEEGNKKDLEECSWISGEEPTIVVGLPAGNYFLKEIIAPKGYELNENMVEFTVLADGNPLAVEMVNELEVEVPDTLSAKSALLLTIAMIDIALGIGIITYVKKNKLEQ